jgi:quercetin dioxygenase-like cupin family protein
MSWHYHNLKTESFLILEGECIARVSLSDSIEDAEEIHLAVGDRLDIKVGLRHRLEAVEDSRILEVSTTHFESDSHRIIRGD